MNFETQKMKVALAAQTLSRSVAIALQMLKETGHPQFQSCSATVKFIEVMSNSVDHC